MRLESETSLSVIVPICNESSVIESLSCELGRVFADAGISWEVIWIDDGSTDGTRGQLARLSLPQRFISLAHNCGKSAAYVAGFQAATGDWIATLDGDGQDAPDDLPVLLREAVQAQVDVVVGVRAARVDSFVRRVSSRVGNLVRRLVLGDRFRDVGCGVRVGRRAAFDSLPYFAGMHRFIPVFMEFQGFRVQEHTVQNRARQGGRSKYGIINRFPAGLFDLLGVRWLLRRRRDWRQVVMEPERSSSQSQPAAPESKP